MTTAEEERSRSARRALVPASPPRPRRRLRAPGRRTAAVLLAVAVLCGGFGAWVLYGSQWLRIERVGISGIDVLTVRQVRDAAAIPLGAPMASLDVGAVRQRLGERLPRIASVEVIRSWPHGVGLKVTERQPELLLKEGARYAELDSAGARFGTSRRPPEGIPLLAMEPEPSPGLRYFGTARLRKEAARVSTALPGTVRRETRTVRVRSFDSIILELSGGRTVVWGSGERSSAKAKSLIAVMKAEKGAEHFDVSVPSAPAASSG